MEEEKERNLGLNPRERKLELYGGRGGEIEGVV